MGDETHHGIQSNNALTPATSPRVGDRVRLRVCRNQREAVEIAPQAAA
jgi:hypothetical protein